MSYFPFFPEDKLDFVELNKYFCCAEAPAPLTSATSSTSLNALGAEVSSGATTTGASNRLAANDAPAKPSFQHSKPVLVSLISGKRSMSVNIFLKMCKNVELLVENLRHSRDEEIGLERLKMLTPLLPSDEEVL